MVSFRSIGLVGVLLAGWLLAGPAPAADIVASIDRNPVHLNESFHILFRVEGGLASEPDFAPLEEDFEILAPSRQSSFSMSNGRMTGSMTWDLEVIAKRSGTLTIPPIRFGSSQTTALTVTVLPPEDSDDSADEDAPLRLEVEVEPRAPYVQAEALVKIRMLFDTRNRFTDRRISEPQISGADALLKKLSDGQSYFATRGGTRYEVIERIYDLHAQRSGTLTLGPITLQARTGSLPQGLGFPSHRVQRVNSEPIEIEVKPIPAGFPRATWLPARDVRLRDNLDDGAVEVAAGEPFTRTITLQADGLTASQLPELATELPAGLRGYPDQPETADDFTNDGIRGTRTQRLAVVPDTPGTLLLPEISVPWWNTLSNSLEYARLPARQLIVRPSAILDGPVQATDADKVTSPGISPGWWPWLAAVLGTGWLLTALLWWYQRRSRGTTDIAMQTVSGAAPGASLKRLRESCSRDDPRGARAALLDWIAAQQPEKGVGLEYLHEHGDEPLRYALDELERALYGQHPEAWQGGRLWNAFDPACLERPGQKETDSGLQALYKV